MKGNLEAEDVNRLKMYQPEEISDLEKQLLADDTGSEPKSDTFAIMHDPTEVESAIRDCIDSGSSSGNPPPGCFSTGDNPQAAARYLRAGSPYSSKYPAIPGCLAFCSDGGRHRPVGDRPLVGL